MPRSEWIGQAEKQTGTASLPAIYLTAGEAMASYTQAGFVSSSVFDMGVLIRQTSVGRDLWFEAISCSIGEGDKAEDLQVTSPAKLPLCG